MPTKTTVGNERLLTVMEWHEIWVCWKRAEAAKDQARRIVEQAAANASRELT